MTARGAAAESRVMRGAYDAASAGWADGPDRVYGRLGAAAVAAIPRPLDGRRVLDVGAGTGAVSRAVAAAGGLAMALDAAEGMARRSLASGVPSVCGDAVALPFREASFDSAVAAFSLTHLLDPVVGLRELTRVVAPGGSVVVCGFGPGPEHPVKIAVEAAARSRGWDPPPWYRWLKSEAEPVLKSSAAMAEAAAAAELADIEVDETPVDVGVLAPLDLVRYRLGMPSIAPFVAGLDPSARAALVTDALDRLGRRPPPLRPVVVVLRALIR